MDEVRVFLELIKLPNGEVQISTGGGVCNDGQMETFDSIANAIKDLNERVVVEYTRMAQSFNEEVKGNTAFSNPYDDSNWDGE